MSHFDSYQLTLICLVHITLNTGSRLTALSGESEVSFHLHFYVGKCDILYQLICRGKTTGLSSEPAKWSCDYVKCVYGWAGVRYIIAKFSRMDSLPNFLTLGAPLARASCPQELR